MAIIKHSLNYEIGLTGGNIMGKIKKLLGLAAVAGTAYVAVKHKDEIVDKVKSVIGDKEDNMAEDFEGVDEDSDGDYDAVYEDSDGDGKPDTVYVDSTGDGVVDKVVDVNGPANQAPTEKMDTTGDGKVDTIAADTTADGKYDTILQDTDGDGKLDTAFVDTTGDGVVDSVVDIDK